MSELDKKDARLATLLQADGRVANARLAEQRHLSEATCWRHSSLKVNYSSISPSKPLICYSLKRFLMSNLLSTGLDAKV